MHQSQKSEKVNEEGGIETKVVNTVDQRSPTGQNQVEPTNEGTTVVHLIRKQPHGGGEGGRGVLGSVGAAVGKALRSAKDAVFGKGKDSTTAE